MPLFWPVVALACIVFVLRSLHFESELLHGALFDDAYISLRHAWVFSIGEGFNYNPGERIEGYTNFLYTAIMSLPLLVGLQGEAWIKSVGVLAGVGLMIVTAGLTRRLAGAAAGALLALGLGLDRGLSVLALSGMETIFCAFLYVLGFALLFRKRNVAGALTFALAAMTRMEAVLIVAVAALFLLVRAAKNASGPGRERWRATAVESAGFAATFATCFGSYYALRWAYYGYPFPNTFYAKVGNPASSWQRGLDHLQLSLEHLHLWLPTLSIAALVPVGILVAWRRDPSGFRRAIADDRNLERVAVASVAAVYMVFVIVGGDHHVTFGDRFVYHVLPFLSIALIVTLAGVAHALLPQSAKSVRLAAGGAGALLVVALATSSCPRLAVSREGVLGWASLGLHLRQTTAPEDAIAATAAGALAYYSQRPAIDMFGLADVHIAHLDVDRLGSGEAAHEKSDLGYVLERAPRHIAVWMPGRGRRPAIPGYELKALVRMDGKHIDPMRILPVDAGTTPEELAALRRGRGRVPGRYRYAVMERSEDAP